MVLLQTFMLGLGVNLERLDSPAVFVPDLLCSNIAVNPCMPFVLQELEFIFALVML